MIKSRNIRQPRHHWTDAWVQLLREFYADVPGAEIAVAMNVPIKAIYQKAKALGLKKSPAFYASDKSARIRRAHQSQAMIASRFQPGFVPWNKGLKGVVTGGVATQFKPGSKPHTTRPVGSYRIVTEKVGVKHLERKVGEAKGSNDKRWTPVTRLVWEAANGPVPAGSVVVFRPGRRTLVPELITLDRIECITRGEHARRNHPRSRSPELGKLVQLRGAITRVINKRSSKSAANETEGATP